MTTERKDKAMNFRKCIEKGRTVGVALWRLVRLRIFPRNNSNTARATCSQDVRAKNVSSETQANRKLYALYRQNHSSPGTEHSETQLGFYQREQLATQRMFGDQENALSNNTKEIGHQYSPTWQLRIEKGRLVWAPPIPVAGYSLFDLLTDATRRLNLEGSACDNSSPNASDEPMRSPTDRSTSD